MSTTPEAMLACIAMNPDDRPMTFTKPKPLHVKIEYTKQNKDKTTGKVCTVKLPHKKTRRQKDAGLLHAPATTQELRHWTLRFFHQVLRLLGLQDTNMHCKVHNTGDMYQQRLQRQR
jgi:hypothetical protein